MKKETMSFAASLTYKPEYPERTAKKNSGDDVTFQTWSNRESMAKSIRMQQKRANHINDWKAIIPLKDAEGY